MRKNFTKIASLFIGIISLSSVGQESMISGKIVGENNLSIPFATILLVDTEDNTLLGTVSEDDGSFVFSSLSNGSYKLKVSFIGYDDYNTDTFTPEQNHKVPDIVLKVSSETLDAVTLTARKPTIVRKSDRIVFNVENSILSRGSTMDILKRTPGVVVNQGAITVRSERVTVYLNGRKVQLDTEEIHTLLQSIGGDVIKTVEVIQNPPAQFDAEGGPVLNIISSKSVAVGYKGSFNARGVYGIFSKHTFGTTQFYKTDKSNLFVNYSFNPRKQSHRSLNFIRYSADGITTEWDQDFERKDWTNAHNANLIYDYQISPNTELSFTTVGLYSPDEFSSTRSSTEVVSPQTEDYTIFTESGLKAERTNIALDLQLSRSFEKGKLSANAHHTIFNRKRSQNLNSEYTDANNFLFRNVSFNSLATQEIDIYTGQLDYATTFGNVAFETGAKVAIIDSQSKIDFLSIEDDGNSGLDQAQNDDFLYDENVYAGYISIARDWEKWSVKSGLRVEQTNSKGNSIILASVNELDYLEWFPTAYVQYKASENHSISLDYSRRVERPRYQDLNPFSYFLNENNFDQGNANLAPAFSNRFNVNYTVQSQYSFDFYYRDNGENIVVLPFQDTNNQVLRTVRQNALDSKSWGIDFTHGRSIANWYYMYSYVSAFHEEEKFLAIESGNVPVTNQIDGFYAYMGNYLTLTKDETLTAEVSLEYMSKFLFGSYVQKPTTAINIGIQKTIWKNRGVLSLGFNDLLNQANARLVSRYRNQNNGYRVFNETQHIEVAFTYKFGNFKLNDNNRAVETKEIERLKEGS